MAQNLNLRPMVSLKWCTERPFIGGSRLSQHFGFLQDQWCLEMKLRRGTFCEIWLHKRFCLNISPSFDLVYECRLKTKRKSFYGSGFFSNNTVCIFSQFLEEEKIRLSQSLEEWVVVCSFTCTETEAFKPFSIQVGNKTVNMSIHDKDGQPPSMDESIQVSQEVPRDLEALSTDISGLLENGTLPDFQLNCQDQIFPVHRSVLAARSEVFRCMFRSGMQESESGSADIEDLDASILESLLKFVYSGKLEDLSEDIASQLYEAADKYAIPSLFKACSYWLVRNLTVDNCVSYLQTADSHSDPDLKGAVASFIQEHPGVFRSTAWSAFLKENSVLPSEVLQTCIVSFVH